MRPGSRARLRGTGLHRRLEAVTGMRPACAISQLSYSPARACAARHLQNYAKPRAPDAHSPDLVWTAVLLPALCAQQAQFPRSATRCPAWRKHSIQRLCTARHSKTTLRQTRGCAAGEGHTSAKAGAESLGWSSTGLEEQDSNLPCARSGSPLSHSAHLSV